MKKKNLFGWLAMAAMVLGTTGCSNDEVVNDYSAENAIQFGTYVGRDAQGRASVFETSDMYGQGFGVYAFYTGQDSWEIYKNKNQTLTPNFMNNTKVYSTDQGTTWTYAPLKYWPNTIDDKVSFFAYAPWSAGGNDALIKTEAGNITFTVAPDVQNQIDLTAVLNQQIDKTNNDRDLDKKVEFEFKHLLSRIEFTLQAAADQTTAGGNINAGTTITLNKIIIGDATNGGFYQSGTYSIINNTWTNTTGAQAFTLETGDFITDSNVLNENKNTKSTLIAEDGDDYIMIIPQENVTFPVYVEYTVATNGNNEAGVSDASSVLNKVTTNISNFTFVANKKYTLNIILGMNTVDLTATVGEWEAGDDIQADLPLNVQ